MRGSTQKILMSCMFNSVVAILLPFYTHTDFYIHYRSHIGVSFYTCYYLQTVPLYLGLKKINHHWSHPGAVVLIGVSKPMASDNTMLSVLLRLIIWTNSDILLIGHTVSMTFKSNYTFHTWKLFWECRPQQMTLILSGTHCVLCNPMPLNTSI